MDMPLLKKKLVYHVGMMDKNLKNKGSYEGTGLSVSTCPDAWLSISESTAGELFLLRKTNGIFLNKHRLTKKQTRQIIEWGANKGYIEEKSLYRYSFFNGDFDMDMYVDCATYEQALEEASGEEDSVSEVQGIVATPLMEKELAESIEIGMTFDLLCTLFAEQEMNVDGVWWNDILDVSILSAPRGVIFNGKLSEWTIQKSKAVM